MNEELQQPKSSGDGEQPHRSSSRKFAEWVSLALSAAIILSLAGFLVRQALRADPPTVPIQVRCLLTEVREVEGRYILPVEVINRGRRTVRDLKVEVSWQPGGNAVGVRTEILLDFLGERSQEQAYVFFEGDPRKGQTVARPLSYLLD